MTHDNIAAPLAAALAERGYENLTAVQQAMLNPEAPGQTAIGGFAYAGGVQLSSTVTLGR